MGGVEAAVKALLQGPPLGGTVALHRNSKKYNLPSARVSLLLQKSGIKVMKIL